MTFKPATLHSVLGVLAAIALSAAASAADTATSQTTESSQQSTFAKPINRLLWLKPQAGRKACPSGTALAVQTDSTGKHIGEPTCMAKPVNTDTSRH